MCQVWKVAIHFTDCPHFLIQFCMKMADTKKTAPWQGIAEAALGGVGSLVSAFSQIGAAKRQHKYNMAEMEQEQKYALEQMEQSQQYNLANMAQQNQYQIDAEKRAQEWNDVGAQITRGQQAGVSALATLGAGSSQSMGVSSAPSSSTPSPAGPPSSKGVSKPGLNFDTSALGKLVQQGRMVDSQIEGIDAEVKLKDAERENVEADTQLKKQQYDSIEWYNLNRRGLELELLSAGVSKAKSDALVADIDSKFQKWKHTEKNDEGYTLAQQELITSINEARALINKYGAEADESSANAGLAIEQAEDLEKTRGSRIAQNLSLADYYDSLTLTNEQKREYDVEYARLKAEEKQIANDFMSWHNSEIKSGRDPRPKFQKIMDVADRANAFLDTYLDYKAAKEGHKQSDKNNRRSTLAQVLLPFIRLILAKK